MDNSAWVICLLIWMRISDTNCHALVKRGSSSGAGVAEQTCGTDKFYCPYDPSDRCKPRSQRCTGNNTCKNPSTMKEEHCSETSNPGEYYVFLGHAKLSDSSSSRKKRKILEHRFVTFRGFTYEFGKSYGVQVLDIADPKYKYKNGQHLNSGGIVRIGRSYCNREDANEVVEEWKNKKYNLVINNCQHFAKAMSYILIYGPCNRPAASRGKREDRDIGLPQYIDRQLRNCSLVCCYDDSSATALIHNSYSLIFVFITMTNLAFFV